MTVSKSGGLSSGLGDFKQAFMTAGQPRTASPSSCSPFRPQPRNRFLAAILNVPMQSEPHLYVLVIGQIQAICGNFPELL